MCDVGRRIAGRSSLFLSLFRLLFDRPIINSHFGQTFIIVALKVGLLTANNSTTLIGDVNHNFVGVSH